jgi:hypothetical protein
MSESTINVTKWILDDPPNSNLKTDKITSLGTKVEQKMAKIRLEKLKNVQILNFS